MQTLSQISKSFLTTALLLIMWSCSGSDYPLRQIYSDGKYDTQFPSEEASQFISDISGSIKLINCLVLYKQFQFRYSEKVTKQNISKVDVASKAFATSNFNRSASGTASIVGLTSSNILFLTNAHIVNFADTIYSFFADETGRQSNILESVSIKQSQMNYAAVTGVGNLEVVVMDNANDIAFVGGTVDHSFPKNIRVFDYKIGNSKELEWGDFVYVFGYPMHYKMLTRGIVSIPEDNDNYFMVDVNVNRGSSGSIVLALRDGVPNFELVGIISWAPAEKQNVLSPKALFDDKRYQVDAKYDGDVFIDEIESVKYGIGRVVSIEAVKKLLRKNYDKITEKGYDISSFKESF